LVKPEQAGSGSRAGSLGERRKGGRGVWCDGTLAQPLGRCVAGAPGSVESLGGGRERHLRPSSVSADLPLDGDG
jgi:hypothetical protein